MKERSDAAVARPVMKKRPQKLDRLRLSEVSLLSGLEQLPWFPNHLLLISVIFSLSVMFKIPFERSETRGDPLGKTCRARGIRSTGN